MSRYSKHITRGSWLFVGIMITLSAFHGVAFSQSQSLTVATDKTRYSAGETVVIKGTIPSSEQPSPLIIQVFDPANTAIFTNVPTPKADGEYLVEIETSDWHVSGTCLIRVTYADEDNEATFEFIGLDSQTPTENLLVTFSDGSSQIVDARMTKGVITKITAVEESATLVFSLATGSEDGKLTVTLPREMIDSKYEPDETGIEEENSFLVLVDGDYTDYNETGSTAADRTLVVPIPAGTQEIMIGGSSMVPEFPLVALGTVAAVVGIVSILGRTKLFKR